MANEQMNKRIAGITTIGLHGLLFVFLFFAVGWRAPNPPYPQYGIELNFGLDDQGSGEIQPQEPVGSVPEASADQKQDEQKRDETPLKEESKQPEQLTANDNDAVAVKDVKKTEEPPLVKPKETIVENTTAKETTKPAAVYKKPSAEVADSKTGQPGSHGDDINKAGDKGSPQGTLDAKALYGKPGGGGGGSSLSLSGWQWDEIPEPKIPDSEPNGRVEFEIKVNAAGEIISIITGQRTVSLETANICRREIEKLTFSKTGTNVPTVSTGKITFVVRSN